MRERNQWNDQSLETAVALLLRGGVLLSAFVVLAGASIYLWRHGHSPVDFRTFHGEPTDLRTIRGIIQNVVQLRGRGIIQLGLLLLIATPVARVAFSVLGFARERDRMYVVFTLIVLGILLYSLFGSA
jgi:uncharacterized membrane protein